MKFLFPILLIIFSVSGQTQNTAKSSLIKVNDDEIKNLFSHACKNPQLFLRTGQYRHFIELLLHYEGNIHDIISLDSISYYSNKFNRNRNYAGAVLILLTEAYNISDRCSGFIKSGYIAFRKMENLKLAKKIYIYADQFDCFGASDSIAQIDLFIKHSSEISTLLKKQWYNLDEKKKIRICKKFKKSFTYSS